MSSEMGGMLLLCDKQGGEQKKNRGLGACFL